MSTNPFNKNACMIMICLFILFSFFKRPTRNPTIKGKSLKIQQTSSKSNIYVYIYIYINYDMFSVLSNTQARDLSSNVYFYSVTYQQSRVLEEQEIEYNNVEALSGKPKIELN